jgi:hypothetical protein
MPDYSPAQGHPASVSARAGATITGGQLVRLAAAPLVPGQVEPTAGNAADGTQGVIGVAGNDAAVDALTGPQAVTVLSGTGVIHHTEAAAAIGVGTLVFSAAQGRVAAAGGIQVGFAVAPSTGTGAAGDPFRVRWLPTR